ncbi:phage portal protein [soil metagenome]
MTFSSFVMDTNQAPRASGAQSSASGSGRRRSQFGYDGIEAKGQRKAATGILRSEDQELLPEQRRRLVSGSRDIVRNYTVAAWGIRKHLDYVTSYSPQFRTGNDARDELLTELMEEWSKASNCDVAGRHSLGRMLRLTEARATIDGDMLLARLKIGKLQAIEGDRVRTPYGGIPAEMGIPSWRLQHGVLTNEVGAAIAFAVNKRLVGSDFNALPMSGGFQFERMVDARHVYQHSYFERFDQVRGISPLASALNTLRDTYEGFNYALAKMKVAQLFGIKFFRKAPEGLGEFEAPTSDSDDEDEESEDDTATPPPGGRDYSVDFGQGSIALDLDPGDNAEFMSNDSPGPGFQDFSQVMIALSLKALDIPYSFYAENFSTYTGARQAILQYEDSCVEKRKNIRALLDWITAWKVLEWWLDGKIPGADIASIKWDWVSRGIPWIDPSNEVTADIDSVNAIMNSRTLALRGRGLDFKTIARQVKQENDFMASLGLAPLNPGPKLMGVAK